MIREAEPADALAIARVHVDSWRRAYVGLVSADELAALDVDDRRAKWERNLAEASSDRVANASSIWVDRRTTVFERSGEVVAFATFGACRDADADAALGEVWALYASPSAWGTGAGRALLEEGVARLKARGRTHVLLWVLVGNDRAIRFYERGGFRATGLRRTTDGLLHEQMARDDGARLERP